MAGAVEVREYKDRSDFEKDARKRAEQGWEIVTQSERTQRSGCMRIIMLGGIGALVFKPKPLIVVTYRRAR